MQAEYQGQLHQPELTVQDCEIIFESLDASEDGELSKTEFVDWLAVGLTRTDAEIKIYAESGPLQRKLASFLFLIKLYLEGPS